MIHTPVSNASNLVSDPNINFDHDVIYDIYIFDTHIMYLHAETSTSILTFWKEKGGVEAVDHEKRPLIWVHYSFSFPIKSPSNFSV